MSLIFSWFFFSFLIFLPSGKASPRRVCYQRGLPRLVSSTIMYMFLSQFLGPLSSIFVVYKNLSNYADDSKKEDLSQLFDI